MLHFLLEIIIMTRSTKTRLLLRDKCKVVHSDRLYRPTMIDNMYEAQHIYYRLCNVHCTVYITLHCTAHNEHCVSQLQQFPNPIPSFMYKHQTDCHTAAETLSNACVTLAMDQGLADINQAIKVTFFNAGSPFFFVFRIKDFFKDLFHNF